MFVPRTPVDLALWAATHPHGFVVSERPPQPIVHTTRCRHALGPASRRVCSEDLAELADWSRGTRDQAIACCRRCMRDVEP